MKKLDLATLNSSIDDYESVSTIRDEIAALLHQPVSPEELFTAFTTLASQGLMQGYVLTSDYRWKAIPATEIKDPSLVWFLTTEEGQASVEREWDLYFKK